MPKAENTKPRLPAMKHWHPACKVMGHEAFLDWLEEAVPNDRVEVLRHAQNPSEILAQSWHPDFDTLSKLWPLVREAQDKNQIRTLGLRIVETVQIHGPDTTEAVRIYAFVFMRGEAL